MGKFRVQNMTAPFYILLVDDSELIGSRIPLLFNNESINVIVEQDPAMALARIRQEVIHLVLLDINLDGWNGIDLLKRIRSEHSHIPVVMLTNQASGKHRELCKSLGSHDFLDKTKEFERLSAVVERLMDQR